MSNTGEPHAVDASAAAASPWLSIDPASQECSAMGNVLSAVDPTLDLDVRWDVVRLSDVRGVANEQSRLQSIGFRVQYLLSSFSAEYFIL